MSTEHDGRGPDERGPIQKVFDFLLYCIFAIIDWFAKLFINIIAVLVTLALLSPLIGIGIFISVVNWESWGFLVISATEVLSTPAQDSEAELERVITAFQWMYISQPDTFHAAAIVMLIFVVTITTLESAMKSREL